MSVLETYLCILKVNITKVGMVFITRTYLSISGLFLNYCIIGKIRTFCSDFILIIAWEASPSVVRSVQPSLVRPGPGDEHHQGQTRDPTRRDLPEVRPLLQISLLALRWDTVVDPDSLNPGSGIGSRVLRTQNWKKYSWKFFILFFYMQFTWKDNIQHFKRWILLTFFGGHFCPPDPNPDPGPQKLNPDPSGYGSGSTTHFFEKKEITFSKQLMASEDKALRYFARYNIFRHCIMIIFCHGGYKWPVRKQGLHIWFGPVILMPRCLA